MKLYKEFIKSYDRKNCSYICSLVFSEGIEVGIIAKFSYIFPIYVHIGLGVISLSCTIIKVKYVQNK